MNFLVVQVQELAGMSIDDSLTRARFDMITVASRATAFASHHDADLILLHLDGADGLEICRMIRTQSDIPVIALTRQGAGMASGLGRSYGFDGQAETPKAFQELIAGLLATRRHAKADAPAEVQDNVLQCGDVRIDLRTREVQVGMQSVQLTRKEFNLLHYLASRPNQVVTRQQLMADIWGDSTAHALIPRNTRTIDTHVNSLRSKLGCRSWVETVRGVGFRFALRSGPETGGAG